MKMSIWSPGCPKSYLATNEKQPILRHMEDFCFQVMPFFIDHPKGDKSEATVNFYYQIWK